MLFVDGENFAARGQATCQLQGRAFEAGGRWRRDIFLWMQRPAKERVVQVAATLPLQAYATRASYYTSVVGSDEDVRNTEEALWALGFTPFVFKKKKDGRSKGVDITLTKDLLTHAFHGHYDAAVLATGDADYTPAVSEVRRMGKQVHLMAFSSGLGDALRLACDSLTNLDPFLHLFPLAKETEPSAK